MQVDESTLITGESKHGEPISIKVDALGDLHWIDSEGKYMEFDGASDIPIDYAEMLIEMLTKAIKKSAEIDDRKVYGETVGATQ